MDVNESVGVGSGFGVAWTVGGRFRPRQPATKRLRDNIPKVSLDSNLRLRSFIGCSIGHRIGIFKFLICHVFYCTDQYPKVVDGGEAVIEEFAGFEEMM